MAEIVLISLSPNYWLFPPVMLQAIASECRSENRSFQGALIHSLTQGLGLDAVLDPRKCHWGSMSYG